MEGRAQCLHTNSSQILCCLRIRLTRKGGSPAQKSSCPDAAEMSWELKPYKLEGIGSTRSALKPQKAKSKVHHFPFIVHMKVYSANVYI